MKAIILAGGKGTRLGSVVSDRPKPLAPVRGEPFLYILVRFLMLHGVQSVYVSTHHMADQFEERLEELRLICPGIKLVKEPSALGTGGAIRYLCESEGLPRHERVLVLNGDTFFNFDLRSFLERFGASSALALKEVPDASRYGTVDVEDGKVQSFLEKNGRHERGLVYAGYSILKVGDLLQFLPPGSSSLEQDFFPVYLRERSDLFGEVFSGQFIDIGVPEDYARANDSFDFRTFAKAPTK